MDNYRLMECIESELEKIADRGLTSGNLDTAFKLVDMLKDIENIEYWRRKEETFDSGYGGRERNDYSNRGTKGKHYVRGHYSRGEDDDSYSRYMNNKSSYRSAKNPNEKQSMVTALEEHLSDLTEELEGMNRDADCIEERAAISRFIQRLENMM